MSVFQSFWVGWGAGWALSKSQTSIKEEENASYGS